jgi:hypothetical protein
VLADGSHCASTGAQVRDVHFGVVEQSDTTNSWAVTGVMGLRAKSPVLKGMKEQGILHDLYFGISFLGGDNGAGMLISIPWGSQG